MNSNALAMNDQKISAYRKQMPVVRLVLLMTLLCALFFAGHAQASEPGTSAETPVWEKKYSTTENSDEVYWLSTSVRGVGFSENGTQMSSTLHIATSSLHGLIFFSKIGEEDWMSNQSDTDLDFTVSIILRDTNLSINGTAIQPAGRQFFYFDDSHVQGTSLTVTDFILMEMKAYGYVRFIIRVNMTNELVDFSYDLPCEQCNFAALYNKGVQDGWKDPAAGTYTKQEEFSTGNAGNSGNQESYYTNSEIETVCNNYINTYNAAIPYLSNAYDLLSNDHPFLGLLSAVTGLEPFADFLTAKEAFDRLDANQMTPEQKTFYQEHKNAVNQTLLGQLIYVIENLSAMGLL